MLTKTIRIFLIIWVYFLHSGLIEEIESIEYVQCKEIEHFCPKGYYFDAKRNRCRNFPGGGEGIFVDSFKRCADNFYGVKPHPERSDHYYVCKKDSVIIGKCYKNEIFDERLNICKSTGESFPKNVTNDEEIMEMANCKHSGRYPVPSNCTMYYTCNFTSGSYTKKVFNCPTSMSFNPIQKKCVYNYKCKPNVIFSRHYSFEEDDNKFPNCTAAGRFRSPHDHSLYYVCRRKKNGAFRQNRYRCPHGSHFNLNHKSCVKISNESVTSEEVIRNLQQQSDETYFVGETFINKFPKDSNKNTSNTVSNEQSKDDLFEKLKHQLSNDDHMIPKVSNNKNDRNAKGSKLDRSFQISLPSVYVKTPNKNTTNENDPLKNVSLSTDETVAPTIDDVRNVDDHSESRRQEIIFNSSEESKTTLDSKIINKNDKFDVSKIKENSDNEKQNNSKFPQKDGNILVEEEKSQIMKDRQNNVGEMLVQLETTSLDKNLTDQLDTLNKNENPLIDNTESGSDKSSIQSLENIGNKQEGMKVDFKQETKSVVPINMEISRHAASEDSSKPKSSRDNFTESKAEVTAENNQEIQGSAISSASESIIFAERPDSGYVEKIQSEENTVKKVGKNENVENIAVADNPRNPNEPNQFNQLVNVENPKLVELNNLSRNTATDIFKNQTSPDIYVSTDSEKNINSESAGKIGDNKNSNFDKIPLSPATLSTENLSTRKNFLYNKENISNNEPEFENTKNNFNNSRTIESIGTELSTETTAKKITDEPSQLNGNDQTSSDITSIDNEKFAKFTKDSVPNDAITIIESTTNEADLLNVQKSAEGTNQSGEVHTTSFADSSKIHSPAIENASSDNVKRDNLSNIENENDLSSLSMENNPRVELVGEAENVSDADDGYSEQNTSTSFMGSLENPEKTEVNSERTEKNPILQIETTVPSVYIDSLPLVKNITDSGSIMDSEDIFLQKNKTDSETEAAIIAKNGSKSTRDPSTTNISELSQIENSENTPDLEKSESTTDLTNEALSGNAEITTNSEQTQILGGRSQYFEAITPFSAFKTVDEISSSVGLLYLDNKSSHTDTVQETLSTNPIEKLDNTSQETSTQADFDQNFDGQRDYPSKIGNVSQTERVNAGSDGNGLSSSEIEVEIEIEEVDDNSGNSTEISIVTEYETLEDTFSKGHEDGEYPKQKGAETTKIVQTPLKNESESSNNTNKAEPIKLPSKGKNVDDRTEETGKSYQEKPMENVEISQKTHLSIEGAEKNSQEDVFTTNEMQERTFPEKGVTVIQEEVSGPLKQLEGLEDQQSKSEQIILKKNESLSSNNANKSEPFKLPTEGKNVDDRTEETGKSDKEKPMENVEISQKSHLFIEGAEKNSQEDVLTTNEMQERTFPEKGVTVIQEEVPGPLKQLEGLEDQQSKSEQIVSKKNESLSSNNANKAEPIKLPTEGKDVDDRTEETGKSDQEKPMENVEISQKSHLSIESAEKNSQEDVFTTNEMQKRTFPEKGVTVIQEEVTGPLKQLEGLEDQQSKSEQIISRKNESLSSDNANKAEPIKLPTEGKNAEDRTEETGKSDQEKPMENVEISQKSHLSIEGAEKNPQEDVFTTNEMQKRTFPEKGVTVIQEEVTGPLKQLEGLEDQQSKSEQIVSKKNESLSSNNANKAEPIKLPTEGKDVDDRTEETGKSDQEKPMENVEISQKSHLSIEGAEKNPQEDVFTTNEMQKRTFPEKGVTVIQEEVTGPLKQLEALEDQQSKSEQIISRKNESLSSDNANKAEPIKLPTEGKNADDRTEETGKSDQEKPMENVEISQNSHLSVEGAEKNSQEDVFTTNEMQKRTFPEKGVTVIQEEVPGPLKQLEGLEDQQSKSEQIISRKNEPLSSDNANKAEPIKLPTEGKNADDRTEETGKSDQEKPMENVEISQNSHLSVEGAEKNSQEDVFTTNQMQEHTFPEKGVTVVQEEVTGLKETEMSTGTVDGDDQRGLPFIESSGSTTGVESDSIIAEGKYYTFENNSANIEPHLSKSIFTGTTKIFEFQTVTDYPQISINSFTGSEIPGSAQNSEVQGYLDEPNSIINFDGVSAMSIKPPTTVRPTARSGSNEALTNIEASEGTEDKGHFTNPDDRQITVNEIPKTDSRQQPEQTKRNSDEIKNNLDASSQNPFSSQEMPNPQNNSDFREDSMNIETNNQNVDDKKPNNLDSNKDDKIAISEIRNIVTSSDANRDNLNGDSETIISTTEMANFGKTSEFVVISKKLDNGTVSLAFLTDNKSTTTQSLSDSNEDSGTITSVGSSPFNVHTEITNPHSDKDENISFSVNQKTFTGKANEMTASFVEESIATDPTKTWKSSDFDESQSVSTEFVDENYSETVGNSPDDLDDSEDVERGHLESTSNKAEVVGNPNTGNQQTVIGPSGEEVILDTDYSKSGNGQGKQPFERSLGSNEFLTTSSPSWSLEKDQSTETTRVGSNDNDFGESNADIVASGAKVGHGNMKDDLRPAVYDKESSAIEGTFGVSGEIAGNEGSDMRTSNKDQILPNDLPARTPSQSTSYEILTSKGENLSSNSGEPFDPSANPDSTAGSTNLQDENNDQTLRNKPKIPSNTAVDPNFNNNNDRDNPVHTKIEKETSPEIILEEPSIIGGAITGTNSVPAPAEESLTKELSLENDRTANGQDIEIKFTIEDSFTEPSQRAVDSNRKESELEQESHVGLTDITQTSEAQALTSNEPTARSDERFQISYPYDTSNSPKDYDNADISIETVKVHVTKPLRLIIHFNHMLKGIQSQYKNGTEFRTIVYK